MTGEQITQLRELLGRIPPGPMDIGEGQNFLSDDECQLIRGALNALPALLDAAEHGPGWRPMSTAPRDGTRVLLRFMAIDATTFSCRLAEWDGEDWYGNSDYYREPDAWFPLPDTEDPMVAEMERLRKENERLQGQLETYRVEFRKPEYEARNELTADRDRLKAKVDAMASDVRTVLLYAEDSDEYAEARDRLRAALKETP